LGNYPDDLKIARVVPVHKTGPLSQIENYRPISILCCVNKIFEKIIYSRIDSFFQRFNLMSENQFGFRRGCSTETASLQLVDYIMPAFENKQYAMALFLDYSKAFDCVNRDILFEKLYRYGIRGTSLSFIKSYFNNRLQHVDFRGSCSNNAPITVGVVQGSCLGPLYYAIYVNDINAYLEPQKLVLFADDTTLLLVGDDLDTLREDMENLMMSVIEWSNFNVLSLNMSKTKCMIFSNRIYDNLYFNLNGSQIDVIDSFVYLGLRIDNKLKYHSHVCYLEAKLSRYCGLSYRLGQYFDLNAARNYYFSFIYSSILYGITVWGGILQCTCRGHRLQSLQNRILKNLFGRFYEYDSIGELYLKTRLLTISKLHIYRCSLFMYKIVNTGWQQRLLHGHLNMGQHTHFTRHVDDYLLPLPTVNNIRINYVYQFLQVWNNLPIELKCVDSFRKFKKAVYNHILIN
jgi:hypothetical protein